jgi:hypothetical protein
MAYKSEMAQKEIYMEDLLGSSMSSMDARKYAIKINENPLFRKAWFRNISEDFYMDLYERWDGAKEMNRLFRVAGQPGSGKSFASLSIVAIARDWFGFEYKNFFSKMDASVEMITRAYEAQRKGESALNRFYLNIDEDSKTYGVGAGQDDAFFEGIMEFLRQRMINVNICNPFEYGGRTFDVQLEVVGYTRDGYMKIIEHSKVDDWNATYRPLGYIVIKAPPQNYVNAYKIEKDKFTKSYMQNLSTRANKDITILDIVFRDMSDSTKELIRSAISGGQERDSSHLIRSGSGKTFEGIGIFNLPEKYVQSLIQSFKWRHFSKEMNMFNRKRADKVIERGIKNGNLRPEWKDVLLTPDEEQEEAKGIKKDAVYVKAKAQARKVDSVSYEDLIK